MKKQDRAPSPPSRETERAKIETAAAEELPGIRRWFHRAHPWVWHLVRCAMLLLMVFVVYRNSFQSGWVLDNKFIIQLDPRNKEASLENLKLIWSKDYWWPRSDTRAYRPIVSTTYLLNWSVLGNGSHSRESEQVAGFHWLNMAAHGINTILAYFLMLKLVRRNWAAFFAAALFAVHPIATESVTNIVGRADELAAMSFIGGTLLYIRSTETRGLRRLPWLLGLAAVFAAGCFSKESAPAFMAVPLLFDGIYRWGSEQYRGRRGRSILFDCLGYLIMAPPFAALLLVRRAIFRNSRVPAQVFVDNPMLRFIWNDASSLSMNIHHWTLARMTACNVATKALWKLIWPANLSSDYSYDQIQLFGWQLSGVENIKAILSALFIAGTLALAVWCYKRHKAISFFVLFYWIAYGPTSNFLVISGSIMGERFLYLPLIAFCGLFVLGVENLSRRIGATIEFDRDSFRRPWPRLVPHALLLLIVVLCGVRSYSRNLDWHSDVTLAESAIKSSPRSFQSYQTLAFAYYQADPIDKIDRILELGETALTIVDPLPNNENGSRLYLHLGIYYGLKGEMAATRNADGSLTMNDRTREWYEKSAQVLERGIEVDLAANDASRTRELQHSKTSVPDVGLPDLYLYLGMAYARLGMDERALEAFRYMRHLDPQEPAAYAQIASTQLALGQVEDAVVSLLQCVILDSQRTDAWQTLMDIYPQINRESTPAVQVMDGRPQLRDDNKLVQQHLLAASREFLKIARSSMRPEMLSKARDVAVNSYHFNPTLLDDALYGKISRPVPPGPVFHTYGKKLRQESTPHSAR